MALSWSIDRISNVIQNSTEPLPINSTNLDEDEIILIRDIFYPKQLDRKPPNNVVTMSLDPSLSMNKNSVYTGEACLQEKIQKKKRGRKKRDPAEGWPKQALSGYNIFYKEERVRILNGLMNDDEKKAFLGNVESNRVPPNKRQGLAGKTKLVGSRLKKKKVAHGKIGFRELVRTISSRWKSLPTDEMDKFNARAKIDQERYSREIQVFLACRQHSSH